MGAGTQTLTLVAAASLLAACHSLLPHQPSHEPDRAVDSRSVDLITREGLANDRTHERALGDGPPDQKPLGDKALPPDTKPTVDAKVGDLWPTCNEVQSLSESASACNQQCTAPGATDLDCDGLPDSKLDPQTTCNRLLFSDGFRGPPELTGKWTAVGTPKWSCGWLKLASNTTIRVKSSAISSSKTMVEAKIKLGATSYQDWAVAITVGDPAGCHFRCEIWVSAKDQPLGGLHFNRIGTGSCSNNGSWNSGKSLPTAAGAEYLLRTWGDGTAQHCMVLKLDGSPAVIDASLPYGQPGLAAQDRISISTSAREAELDHVRVFELK